MQVRVSILLVFQLFVNVFFVYKLFFALKIAQFSVMIVVSFILGDFLMQLNECINFMLTNVQNAVFLCFKKQLQQFNVTPIQYALLKCLWDEDEQAPSQLAQHLCLDSSTVTGIMGRLEEKSLIVREYCKTDRRRIIVCLTDAGRALQKPIEALIEETNRLVTRGISAEQLQTLRSDLLHIAEQANELAAQ